MPKTSRSSGSADASHDLPPATRKRGTRGVSRTALDCRYNRHPKIRMGTNPGSSTFISSAMSGTRSSGRLRSGRGNEKWLRHHAACLPRVEGFRQGCSGQGDSSAETKLAVSLRSPSEPGLSLPTVQRKNLLSHEFHSSRTLRGRRWASSRP